MVSILFLPHAEEQFRGRFIIESEALFNRVALCDNWAHDFLPLAQVAGALNAIGFSGNTGEDEIDGGFLRRRVAGLNRQRWDESQAPNESVFSCSSIERMANAKKVCSWVGPISDAKVEPIRVVVLD